MDYGIGVSHWNAISDPAAVRGHNITYAWCKATEGTSFTDPEFARHVRRLRGAGIVVGAYHFMRGGTVREQVRHFRRVASRAGCLDRGSLLPMLDMEHHEVAGAADAVIREFYDLLGVDLAEVYANLNWWQNHLHRGAWGKRNLLGHIARYNGDPGHPGWDGDPRLAVHQHTSSGRVNGIPGNVDRNVTIGSYQLSDLRLGGVDEPVQPMPPTKPPAGGGGLAPKSASDVWVVNRGDTLSVIAAAWGVTVSAVAVANGIDDPNLIFTGQWIYRPGTRKTRRAPKPRRRVYVVTSGDTVWGLARRFNTTVPVLVKINHIANPDRIDVGQRLRLPSRVWRHRRRAYVVRRGDTLSDIGIKLGVSWQRLARTNRIDNPDLIRPGQLIHY